MSPVNILFNEAFQIGGSSTGTTHTPFKLLKSDFFQQKLLSTEIVQISVNTLHVVSVFFEDGESPETFSGNVGSIGKLAVQFITVTEDTSSAQTLYIKVNSQRNHSEIITKATLTAPVKVLNSIKVLGLYFS